MKSPPQPSSSSSRRRSPFTAYFLVICFFLFVAFLYSEDFACIFRGPFLFSSSIQDYSAPKEKDDSAAAEEQKKEAVPFALGRGKKGCDLFEGEWVYDEEGSPQYEEEECPYIQPQLTCQAHGRPDSTYQHWRWQPRRCYLPSFNATLMLENLRGKRMMYVGDSLNRGQFVSMVCLLHRIIPESSKSMETFGSLTVFKAKDYNATIEFYWAPFLVESNSDNAVVHRISDRIIRVRSINMHAQHWKGADVLVFNTYLWWMTGQKMKILYLFLQAIDSLLTITSSAFIMHGSICCLVCRRGSFNGDMKNVVEMETEDAYRLALRRMVKWVEKNMNPNKTRVFFTSMSPSHEMSMGWGGDPDRNCYNETTPITDPNYWGRSSSKSIMRMIHEVFDGSKAQITVVNITQLSEYRKDAHTSIYKKQWSPLTPEQLANPKSYADCVHWCLPGLQDTWNELLYAKLFFP